MASGILAPSSLNELLLLEADAGRLIWRLRDDHWFPVGRHGRAHNAAKWNAKFAGCRALEGVGASHGYKSGAILNRQYLAHRVIFAMTHGFWPAGVDHIDGNKLNNRPSNLREASQSQNALNRGGNESTRFIGVKKGPASNFYASIRIGGRSTHIGTFPTARDAAVARDRVALAERGEFARLNFPELRDG